MQLSEGQFVQLAVAALFQKSLGLFLVLLRRTVGAIGFDQRGKGAVLLHQLRIKGRVRHHRRVAQPHIQLLEAAFHLV